MLSWIVCITIYVIAQNFGYAALQVWLLRRHAPGPKFLSVAACLWALLMSGLFVMEVFEPATWKPSMRDWLYLPMAVEMVWNILFLPVLFPGMILGVLFVRLFRPVAKSQPVTQNGISRRRFLYLASYGAAPAVALGLGVHGTLTRTDLNRREFVVPIAGLPPDLEGFTIAHVSDLHSGLFVGPERLKLMTEAANSLNADLAVITGDIINREMSEFPAALTAIQGIRSRYGTYLCEGNHDVIPGEGVLAAACARNHLPMLSHVCVPRGIGAARLLIAGLPWMKGDFGGRPELVSNLFPPRQEGDVRLLLAHHPHVFDIADSADLILSGHTHGGQIMFGNIGLGSLRFKYCSGRFQRGNTTMIVSNGCGDWFPCRIGAPAEVSLVRLTKA